MRTQHILVMALTWILGAATWTRAQEKPPQLLFSYDPAKADTRLAAIFLRPNTAQESYFFLRNPSEDKKQYNLTLLKRGAGAQAEAIAAGSITLGNKETKRINFAKPKEAPPAALPLTGPPFQLQVAIAEVRKGKELPATVVPVDVHLMSPSEYVVPKGATYDSDKKRLTMRFAANDGFSGPLCPVRLVFKNEALSGLTAEPTGTLKDDLRSAGDEVVLFADFAQAPKNGRIYVTVDGYQRAFMYKCTFDKGLLERLKFDRRVRLLAPGYAKPGEKFLVQMEVDGDLAAPARLEVGLDRGSDQQERFITKVFPGLREQKVELTVQKGGIALKTAVQDWTAPIDTAGVDGVRRLRARLLDGLTPANPEKTLNIANEQNLSDEALPLFQKDGGHGFATLRFDQNSVLADTVLDGPPQQVKITTAPEKHRLGTPLYLGAQGTAKHAAITSVVFFIGAPDKDGKLPQALTPAKFDPKRKEWAAELKIAPDQKGPVEVHVCFTNAIGLRAFDKRTIPVFEAGGVGAAQISGTVIGRGDIKQPNLKVFLKDAKDPKAADKANATTDKDGFYKFEDVAPGSYVVYAEKTFQGVGKRIGRATVNVVQGTLEYTANLSLTMTK